MSDNWFSNIEKKLYQLSGNLNKNLTRYGYILKQQWQTQKGVNFMSVACNVAQNAQTIVLYVTGFNTVQDFPQLRNIAILILGIESWSIPILEFSRIFYVCFCYSQNQLIRSLWCFIFLTSLYEYNYYLILQVFKTDKAGTILALTTHRRSWTCSTSEGIIKTKPVSSQYTLHSYLKFTCLTKTSMT